MRRITWGSVTNPEDPRRATAAPAHLDVDPEYPAEQFRPTPPSRWPTAAWTYARSVRQATRLSSPSRAGHTKSTPAAASAASAPPAGVPPGRAAACPDTRTVGSFQPKLSTSHDDPPNNRLPESRKAEKVDTRRTHRDSSSTCSRDACVGWMASHARRAIATRRRGRRTLREVAREIGIGPSTLLRVESGRVPDGATFGRLCAWLGVDPAVFFGTPPAHEQPKSDEPQPMQALAQMLLWAAHLQPSPSESLPDEHP